MKAHKKHNIPLYILSCIYFILIVCVHFFKSEISDNSIFKDISGDLIISAISGITFFIIGMHFQKENDIKLEEIHSELRREITIRNYDRMINFLKSGTSYNFFSSRF